ncbi:MAG: cardiolipin synthase [Xanthobacteraceae bacterium]|jgi:cardiolipin synthase|nr:cardiolipin synthase [Xanthobacteraceae bacterium]
MISFLLEYWPQVTIVGSGVIGTSAAVHAAMTKDDVRAAIGWVGVIMLSPVIGALLYLVAGINRIRQSAAGQRRADVERGHSHAFAPPVAIPVPPGFASMKNLGDQVAAFPLTAGNAVSLLDGGDVAYPEMLAAIGAAERHIALSSYIFDNDPVGVQFAEALIAAQARGVAVRVLIDAVGARYSRPSIVARLREADVTTALFMGNLVGLRLPYANLRSHRKMLVVDGALAFTGGMNIRAQFASAFAGADVAHDTHFRVEGPAVGQLLTVFAHDWSFTTMERLTGDAWQIREGAPRGGVAVRVVPSGPDRDLACTHSMIMGALAVAQHSVKICSPYFLPDLQLIGALGVAGRRGVDVDIVIPSNNNLKLVDCAMTAQLDQVLEANCRVWRASGVFDHSKLLAVDGEWAYVGSSNLDPRSLRLNFELDLEVYDPMLSGEIAQRIAGKIAGARAETLETLRARPFVIKLRNRAVWLGTPYL